MTLLSVLLWCLYPLAPARRLYELSRHLLQRLLCALSDACWIDWLEADPDDPNGFASFERCLDNLEASIDTLIYLRAREMLGLSHDTWTRPKELPLQPRRSRSFHDLWRRLEACVLKFGDIERLAARRALRLQHLLDAPPRTPEDIATAARAATTTIQQQSNSGIAGASAASTLARVMVVMALIALAATTRAGMRIRAPPWQTPTPYSPLPIPSKRQLPRPRAHVRTVRNSHAYPRVARK